MRSPQSAKPSVLLIDTQAAQRQLRATVFRNCEIDVHVAESLADALTLCGTKHYDMVLLPGRQSHAEHNWMCDALWKVTPRQRIAIFVGPPHYVREMVGDPQAQQGRRTRSVTQWRIVRSQPLQPDWGAFIRRLLATR